MKDPFDPELLKLKDEEIVLLVQKGNTLFFEILISRYEERLEKYLNKFFLNREDIQDLLQDVFIKTFVNIQSFDTGQKFSPWIYRITHNEAVNLFKKNSHKPFSFDIFDESLVFIHPKAKEDTQDIIEKQIIKKYLDQVLEKLDSKYREIITLYFYEDFSYKDIADILKIPTTLVGVRIQRGKIQIKNLLKEKGITENI